jgi:hypothetical protein
MQQTLQARLGSSGWDGVGVGWGGGGEGGGRNRIPPQKQWGEERVINFD